MNLEAIELQRLAQSIAEIEGLRSKFRSFASPSDFARIDAELNASKATILQNLNQIELQSPQNYSSEALPVDLAGPQNDVASIRQQFALGLDPNKTDPLQEDLNQQEWKLYGLYDQANEEEAFAPDDPNAFRDWALASSLHVDPAELSDQEWGRAETNEKSRDEGGDGGPDVKKSTLPKNPSPPAGREFGRLESWINESMLDDE